MTVTIRQYFEELVKEATTIEEVDEVTDYEEEIFHLMEEDYDRFELWAVEEGIDLKAMIEGVGGVYEVLQLWAWDMGEM